MKMLTYFHGSSTAARKVWTLLPVVAYPGQSCKLGAQHSPLKVPPYTPGAPESEDLLLGGGRTGGLFACGQDASIEDVSQSLAGKLGAIEGRLTEFRQIFKAWF